MILVFLYISQFIIEETTLNQSCNIQNSHYIDHMYIFMGLNHKPPFHKEQQLSHLSSYICHSSALLLSLVAYCNHPSKLHVYFFSLFFPCYFCPLYQAIQKLFMAFACQAFSLSPLFFSPQDSPIFLQYSTHFSVIIVK